MGAEAREMVQAVVGAAGALALGVEEGRSESAAAAAAALCTIDGPNSYFPLQAPARDATLICSLSNFDAYLVTRIHKAPKPFTFSVKSVDNLDLFERAADYHHVFSCPVGDGLIWLEKILLARVSFMQIWGFEVSLSFSPNLTFFPTVPRPPSRTSCIVYQSPEPNPCSKIH